MLLRRFLSVFLLAVILSGVVSAFADVEQPSAMAISAADEQSGTDQVDKVSEDEAKEVSAKLSIAFKRPLPPVYQGPPGCRKPPGCFPGRYCLAVCWNR